jgi:hypothetical protein
MNRRDIELLSAYLDGELKGSDSARLETRLKTDPELASVLNDLRGTRALLRKLPSRKAPRNFTLTRTMVGQNPPLPRTYPIFRFATAVATLLFFFSFAANALGPQLAQPMNFGRGGGAPEAEVQSYAEAPATEEPLAVGPAAAAPMAPAPAEPQASDSTASEEPPMAMAPMTTEVPPTAEMRVMETQAAKNGEGDNAVGQGQPPVVEEPLQSSQAQSPSPLVPSAWQIGMAVIAVLGLLMMGLMRQLSTRRWK